MQMQLYGAVQSNAFPIFSLHSEYCIVLLRCYAYIAWQRMMKKVSKNWNRIKRTNNEEKMVTLERVHVIYGFYIIITDDCHDHSTKCMMWKYFVNGTESMLWCVYCVYVILVLGSHYS